MTYAAQIPVTSTAKQLPMGSNMTILGDATNPVYLGGANVSSTNGARVPASAVLNLGNIGSGPLYVVTATTATISVISG